MKAVLFFMLLFFSGNLYSQKKNSISIMSNSSKLFSYYTYGKYRKNVQVKENPSLTFLRKINEPKNIYLGLSIGLRTYFFNEYDQQLATDLYNRYSNFNISLNFRKEDYFGRRSKLFGEVGLGLNTGINAVIIDYYNTELPSSKLGSSLRVTAYGGYQYVINSKWKFELGFLGQNDILSNMFIKERKIKFVSSTIVNSMDFTF